MQFIPTTVALAYRAAATTASATTSAAAASASPTAHAKTSSDQTPFLYFIALGLGIVFTNLWVILGLKYCFRNRRRNAMLARGLADDASFNGAGDELGYYMNPLLAPEFSRRRRRERRLMKAEELNERFPVLKYKEWGAEREKLGLSTEGGISAEAAANTAAGVAPSASAAVSIHAAGSESNISDSLPVKQNESAEPSQRPELPSSSTVVIVGDSDHEQPTDKKAAGQTVVEVLAPMTDDSSSDHDHSHQEQSEAQPEHEEEEDDEEFHGTLAPPEVVDSVGDVCAVCLDSIEPDHDIRALGCNHVFHDECITPWLTTRRASCPLCKMDFSTARYRQETAAAAAAAAEAGAIAEPEQAHTTDTNGAPIDATRNIMDAIEASRPTGHSDPERGGQRPRRSILDRLFGPANPPAAYA